MIDKILVAYATCTGSTTGVASAIARVLTENNIPVDLLPLQDVKDLAPYQAVVAGSPIQDRQWLPEAMQFLRIHRSELAQKPFATFTLCMTLAMKNGEKYHPEILQWLAPVRRIAQPVSEGLFTGVLDISKIPSLGDRAKFRLSVFFGVWSEGDHRDWDAIHAWAKALPARLFRE